MEIRDVKILLVEDNPGDARLMLEMLKESRNLNYLATVAENLSSAISTLDNFEFDIIILDLNLPDSNGLETLDSLIRATGGHVPVIVMTGLNDEDTGTSAIERGADDYLVKGDVNSNQILRSVRYTLERNKVLKDLKESEERYRIFINATDDMAFLKDDQFRYLIINERNAAFMGKQQNEIIGKTDFELLTDVTASACRDSDIKALSQNSIFISEENSGDRIYETRKFPVRLKNNLIGVGGFIRDVTDLRKSTQAIENAAHEWRITFDSIEDAIWLIDPDFKIIRANAASEKMLGISPAELVGKYCWSVVHGTEVPIEGCPFLRVKESLVPETSQMYINDKWMNITVYPVTDDNGELIRIVHTIRDVTDQKLAEDTLILRSTAMENAANAIVITDLTGNYIWANPAFEHLTGYKSEEIIGQNSRDLVKSGKHDAEFYKELWDTITSGRIWTGEITNKRKDGSLYTEEMTIAPVKNSSGEIHNYVAIKQDISEKKYASDILNARLSLINYSVDHTLEELLIKALDESERFTSSSISFFHFVDENQTSLTLQAWSTETMQKFCKAEGKGSHYDVADAGVWADCVRERKPVIHNDYNSMPDRKGMPVGHAFVSRELVVPIMRDDKIKGILGIGNKTSDYIERDIAVTAYFADVIWDVVERKRTEDYLKQMNLELELRVANRTSELEKANKELDSFSYSVSHDLRAPLRHVTGFLEMLKNEIGDIHNEKVNHYLEVISDSSKRMGQLIDDLLSFSRMGRTSLSHQNVNMEMLVDEILKEYAEDDGFNKINFIRHPLAEVKGDRAMLGVVFNNLISNAIKFTGKTVNPEIEIGCRSTPGEHEFYVRDNGAGFNMNYAEKLFGVFQRLHSDQEFKGTGIGLAMVKSIIDRHHGRIWAESEPAKGACFYFVLPADETE